ncbi:MAG: 23S rRNA (adenine(2030)-N(6))-methyltransferase RlmJ [Rickettsiaceae bacterium]|nr:MAG: 23S rRNA (adenine(2030)-N(6))-methyltransferase RlmJ [Rickettsiaceae bacterium]
MNYRHIYHAGNFADIFKHLILIEVLKNFLKKDKPFAVLDAFAGCGIYDISSDQALRTKESALGIEKLFELQNSEQHPQQIKFFLGNIQKTGQQNLYPGSPIIIKNLIRQDDRLIACELHKQDYQSLKQLIPAAYNMDAYTAIKAFLPFKEKRGMIFLDPPYEVKNEFDKLLAALRIIQHRSVNTCCMIWYPIKEESVINAFYHELKSLKFAEILQIDFELAIAQKINNANVVPKIPLHKCGVLIVNPPNIRSEIISSLEYLTHNVYDKEATYKVSIL